VSISTSYSYSYSSVTVTVQFSSVTVTGTVTVTVIGTLPLGKVPDALLWSHTHSREPKTAFHFKSGSNPASPQQAILNILMIKNTMVMVQNVSVAGAAKTCPHPIDRGQDRTRGN
jgi:hypothetical protein